MSDDWRHEALLQQRALWDHLEAATEALCPGWSDLIKRPSYDPPRLSGCYEASFGWVHVRPQCRCKGGRR